MNSKEKNDPVTNEAFAAFEQMREEAKEFPELSPEEIDEEIAASRMERKQNK